MGQNWGQTLLLTLHRIPLRRLRVGRGLCLFSMPVVSRGDRREAIFVRDADRLEFLRTAGQTGQNRELRRGFTGQRECQ